MTDAAQAVHLTGLVTPANAVTVARILLSPLLFLVILENEATLGTSWGAVALGGLLAASDVIDGRLARRSATVSRSGAFLDPLADKIAVLGTMLCLVAVDRYFWLPVALIAAREIAISLWRMRWARMGLSVPARRSAKWKTLVQGLALFLAVLPPLEDNQAVVDVALWVAVAFTLFSGWQYLRDGASATSLTGSH
jgi:CDP-diacylglycerol--glycerol-3-phosphate 3-phosphatidyltransferase